MRDLPHDDEWTPDRLRAIGERVRAERLRQHLTQDQVWQAARLERRTVQNVEAGREMKVSTLLRIAWVLEVPPGDLIG
ncbi:helix-turn-helix transcriptional regulator [Streptomyces sp. STCH 565 A]|uniref:helix-turn-helix domain-containing protein n=1 Tax=Streptomyces sp. STCH 565 A TaxID=2950532 RepID=UPI002074DF3C|nr:helix-turn-helix transcriptional regulator [Streptomyces sp. STCH 565 A]MCM8548866.1 helix-turn-helix domain-containing protein [Streptomyces sp. STCH 565 A]